MASSLSASGGQSRLGVRNLETGQGKITAINVSRSAMYFGFRYYSFRYFFVSVPYRIVSRSIVTF